MDSQPESSEEVDLSYSPVPEEGRARESGPVRTVLVVGAIGRAADPTGAPGNRFRLFLSIRQALQSMGLRLSWVPLEYDKHGQLPATAVKAFELQAAALRESLAGVLLLDAGYGREQPLWQLAAETVSCPVVWFHSSPLDEEIELTADLPAHCHVLEPDWKLAGETLVSHLTSQYHPQRVILLPGPGETRLHHHMNEVRRGLSRAWGARWVDVLDWETVFPEKTMSCERPSILARVARLALQDTGLRPYDLDLFFEAAFARHANLWICTDDLLALAALEHLERYPRPSRPGVIGFGNHPFALQKGLCTVELGWSALTEAAVEKFTGLGRRACNIRAMVIPGPSGTPSEDSEYLNEESR